MSKQKNGCSERKRLGMRSGFILSRKVLTGMATLLMGASLVFPWNTSAHNIDLDKAWEAARNYARKVRKESSGKYLHYSTNCVRAFPGHNHIVRCLIDFQNAKDAAAGVYTCRESIEILMLPHSRSGQMNYDLRWMHTSTNQCGSRRL